MFLQGMKKQIAYAYAKEIYCYICNIYMEKKIKYCYCSSNIYGPHDNFHQ